MIRVGLGLRVCHNVSSFRWGAVVHIGLMSFDVSCLVVELSVSAALRSMMHVDGNTKLKIAVRLVICVNCTAFYYCVTPAVARHDVRLSAYRVTTSAHVHVLMVESNDDSVEVEPKSLL